MVAILSIPISEANVPTVVRWYASGIDNNPEDNEPQDGDDLDYTEDKFNYSIPLRRDEKMNASYAPSPYPLTPKNCTMIRVVKKTAIQMPMLYSCQ